MPSTDRLTAIIKLDHQNGEAECYITYDAPVTNNNSIGKSAAPI